LSVRVTGFDLKDGKLVPKTGKARWGRLPANKQIAARKNEKSKVTPAPRRKAMALPELEDPKNE